MTKRILFAGILGGVALFFWGGLSHMVIGLGEVGVHSLPQQQPVLDGMKSSIASPGLYYFPQGDAAHHLTPAEENGPWGILIYHMTGASFAMGRQLVNECILNVIQALFAAFLLSLASGLGSYVSRVGFVVMLGFLGAIGMSVEYWNWYGFPANYTAAAIADKVIGFLIVGLIAAVFVRPASSRISAVAPARAA